jgi:hypothetical protein
MNAVVRLHDQIALNTGAIKMWIGSSTGIDALEEHFLQLRESK